MTFTLVAILVLLWARATHKPFAELGFVAPASWPSTVVEAVVFGAAFKVVMKALVMPLLHAPDANQTYHYLEGNAAALPGAVLLMIVGGGFGEETVFRGFLFDRLGKLFGRSGRATAGIVALTSALFAAFHYPDQGVPGVEQAIITGLVFGTIFASTRRIWFVMIAHAAFDLAAVAMIYYEIEARVAHLIF
jgi:membrane protease YdiL (CAAX protease family)